ncbi:ATP-binding cassette domain-containing protein [Planctomicrobium sp. SH664]|uniref:ATP-binding cassette domain-containing protein n=1 Tax=Planctomicrobium sp. SH664 TaxID=3448125 RepID=UPI003F5B6E38
MVSDVWQLENIRLGPKHRPRVEIADLKIPAGVTALLGDSGAGKTSLLNLLVRFEQPGQGTLRFSASAAKERPAPGMPLAWVPADAGLWPGLTVRQQIAVVIPEGPASADRTQQLLTDFDLASIAQQYPETLSMGERARLAVARAIASQAAVWVMDEPLAHIDSRRLPQYWDAVEAALQQQQSTLIFSTHSIEVALRLANQAICLQAGKVLWQGPISELYDSPPDEVTAGFLGPCNWFTAEESRHWFPQQISGCLRPERLQLLPQPGTPLVVERHQFTGAVAETRLRHAVTQSTRTIYHRPAGRNTLQPGLSISLRILSCWLWLMLCLCCGCVENEDTSPQLSLQPVRTYCVPAEGAMLPAPRGMTFGPEGELYILDNAGRVIVYDENGNLIRRWWMPEYKVGKPEGAWLLLDGRIAVADTHYHRVMFFDREGHVLGTLGEQGEGPGQFIYTVSVVQDPSGNLYVAEYGGNDRIQKFTADGQFLSAFGKPGTEPGEFQRLSSICWKDGILYAADALNSRVLAFRDDGTFLNVVGDANSCDLRYPYDIALAPDGTLFVAEYGAGRITQLTTEGKLIGHYGSEGRGAGQFWTPWGIAVNRTGKVVVADTGNRRVVELQP